MQPELRAAVLPGPASFYNCPPRSSCFLPSSFRPLVLCMHIFQGPGRGDVTRIREGGRTDRQQVE